MREKASPIPDYGNKIGLIYIVYDTYANLRYKWEFPIPNFGINLNINYKMFCIQMYPRSCIFANRGFRLL